jgi:hypothetical protein
MLRALGGGLLVAYLYRDSPWKLLNKMSKIVRVRRKDSGVNFQGNQRQMRIDDVGGVGFRQQSTDFVGVVFGKRDYLARFDVWFPADRKGSAFANNAVFAPSESSG